jgi:adenylate cyclase
MKSAPSADDPEAVREELARIIASRDFDASDRNRRFLSYVVEETLAGRANRIKAYSIATSVFGRDESLDPQLDSIVRIEAGRLRRSLERYYLTSGGHSALRIVIPRGSYVPHFLAGATKLRSEDSQTDVQFHRHDNVEKRRRKPVILVLDIADESTPPVPFLDSGISRQIVVGLTRFPALSVFGQSSIQFADPGQDLDRIRRQLGIDFFVTGFLFHAADRLHLDVMLIDAHTGRYVWADTFDRPCGPGDLLLMRDEVASNVVRTIALPWGVIFSNVAADSHVKMPDDLDSFDAIVRYHQYAATFDPALYPRARIAAERAVEIDPEFSEVWACLSMLQTEVVRFGHHFDGDPSPSMIIDGAIENARRAFLYRPLQARDSWRSARPTGSRETSKAP